MSREKHRTEEGVNRAGCPYFNRDFLNTYDCGGPRMYRFDRPRRR